MCFKNVFTDQPYQPPAKETNQSPVDPVVAPLPTFDKIPVDLDSIFQSQSSQHPRLNLNEVFDFDSSPTSECCTSPEIFANDGPHQAAMDLVYGRRPVFNGHTRPPEYMYQQQNMAPCISAAAGGYSDPPCYTAHQVHHRGHPHHHQHNPHHTMCPLYPGLFSSLQNLDIDGGNQYSPESDLESKYGVIPATSLSSTSNSTASVNLQPQTLCKVCGDIASGNHFGVQSCEACKSFFRRSVRAGARYACRANRMCSIEKHTRNRCQYCRLQKCIQRGMRREAVQEERTPPVSKLQRATTPTQLGYQQQQQQPSFIPPTASTPPLSNTTFNSYDGCSPASPVVPNMMMQNQRLFGSLPNLKIGLESERSHYNFFPSGLETYTTTNSRPTTPGSATDIPLPHSQCTGPSSASNVTPSVLVEADVQTDLPPENVISKEGVKLEDVFEGARQSLLRIIEWGKRIPAFMSLSLDDQVKLLKSSWCEHVLLKQTTRINSKANTLVLSSGVTCHKDQIDDPEMRKIVERLSHEVSYWFDLLHIDRVEMACLKGIILFNPDAKGLAPSSRKRVELFQEQILQALEQRCKNVYPVTPLRYSKLLLRLAPLKSIALESTQHMEVQRTLGNAKMDNIFNELLDFD